MHNIAEGFDAGSDAEFIRFLKMARRSASEVQSQLFLALDRDYITEDERIKTDELAVEGSFIFCWVFGRSVGGENASLARGGRHRIGHCQVDEVQLADDRARHHEGVHVVLPEAERQFRSAV